MTRGTSPSTSADGGVCASASATQVIVLVADGFGSAAATAYRHFQEGTPPLWESGVQALVRTGSASSPVTDSAAAATAYATGVKTYNGGVAVDVHGEPLPSVLDLASRAGMATGIVSTAAITDATPAAFAASAPDRADHLGIAQQYVDNGDLDVILGGGGASFLGDPDGDGASTLAEAVEDGFTLVSTPEQMETATGDRLLGLFSDEAFDAPIGHGALGDRPPDEPSLAAMTDVALSRLSADQDGFFLLVEEEATDDAGHANDSAAMMAAARSYERALEVALAYAEANPGTLVISVADHETGGVTLELGPARTPAIYEGFTASYAEILVALQATAGSFPDDADPGLVLDAVNATLLALTGGSVALTGAELASILDATGPAAYAALADLLNARGGLDYSTNGHTAADVVLSAWGSGADLRGGVIENSAVAGWLAEAMGLSFDEAAGGCPASPEEARSEPVLPPDLDLLLA